jgi:predicted nucleotide-binding protein (sugar kinase/HSP70/actin superfamily)
LETDYTQPRPLCKITGEFWAQTTEGDGNFNMFSFLQREGAEVLTEPTATWFFYLLAQARSKLEDRRGLARPPAWNFAARAREGWRFRATWLKLTLANRLVRRDYERMRAALGNVPHPQLNQFELQRLADPYYPRKCVGGEGHLEVAKSIYYTRHNLAHMILSLKPFGCLPSTQSDGAQAAVMADHPDLNFLAVETSGEGDVNAHSRVMMVLSEARARCRREFEACVERTGYSLHQIRAYVADHAELRRPLQNVPREPGVAGKAANFVLHVARRMKADPALRDSQPV